MSVPPTRTSRSPRPGPRVTGRVPLPDALAEARATRPRGPETLAVRVVESPAALWIDRLVEIDGPLTFGREPGAGGLVIDDKKMSSRHATLDVQAGQLVFRDERSKNGTLVDGVKTSHGTLADGDFIRLGQTLLVATRRGPDGPPEDPLHDLVGVSPAFRRVCAAAIAAAEGAEPLALVGPLGVESEPLARLVHRRGRGADGGPFVALDVSVLPRERVDDALFGPTGALRTAHGGTLLLTEIAALDAPAQARLLEVLTPRPPDTGRARRPATSPLDVRVVVALDPEVAPAVTTGRFRADLYTRLVTASIVVPPLTERREDVLRLVRHHAGLVPGQPLFEVEAAEQLLAYAWPENRREVRQLVMRIAGKRRPLAQADLPKTVVPGVAPLAPPEPIVNNDALQRRRS